MPLILVVALVIVAAGAVTSVAVPAIVGGDKEPAPLPEPAPAVAPAEPGAPAQEDAALVSQRAIQRAIFEGGYQDDVRALPGRVQDLLAQPGSVATYDAVKGIGWNGPYLRATGTYPAGAAGRGFTTGASGYAQNAGDPALLDPYGNPFVLDPVGAPTRVLSAGPDGVLGSSDDHALVFP